MPTDREVAAAYKVVRRAVVDALNDGGFEAEWIEENGAIYSFIDVDIGRVVVYFPTLVFGGLMSDRQRAAAEAHADVLVEKLRARGVPVPPEGH